MSFSLSLSGGGCRAAAHIGILKSLEEHRLKPAAISGTSAGALVSALYCTGFTISQLESICFELELYGEKLIDWDILSIMYSAIGLTLGKDKTALSLLKGKRFYLFLKKLFKKAHISSAKLPLFISTTDISTGNTIVFSNISPKHKLANTIWQNDILLCDAVYASCCLPSVFPPFEYNGHLLVDGGITNNLPVDLLFAADIQNIIAVDLGSIISDNIISSLPEVIYRSISIMGDRLKSCYVAGEKLRIVPNLPSEAGILSFDKISEFIKAGFDSANELIPLIKSF